VASLAYWPPASPAAAARRLAIGLTALFLLSPATRFGYFIYPISLYAWAVLADGEAARRARRATVDLDLPGFGTAGPGEPGGAAGSGGAGSHGADLDGADSAGAGLDEAVPAGRGR
jgi:hypothetical protein